MLAIELKNTPFPQKYVIFSLHKVYIEHKGTRFQILSSQRYHSHNKSRTFFSNTHQIPNILNAKLHKVCIEHKGTRFQILSSLRYHSHNKSRTFFSNTHQIPNILNAKLHNSKDTLQRIKRWSIVFILPWHIQHQLTI